MAALQREVERLQQQMRDERSALLAARDDQQQVQAPAIAARQTARVWSEGATRMPIAGRALSSSAIVATIEREAHDRERAAKAAQRALDVATARAADATAELAGTERRLAAFRRALGQQTARDKALLEGGEAIERLVREGNFPRTGWGGTGGTVTPQRIDTYLESKASPMAGNGVYFMQAGARYDVDPRFLVAIAGAESYFGLETCADFNAWGWGCPTRPFSFASWEQAIDTVAKGLRENYLDEGRASVVEIHAKYAPVGASNDPTNFNLAWPLNVSKFLVEQGGNPQNVRGAGGRVG